jgi:acylglycerol lipase
VTHGPLDSVKAALAPLMLAAILAACAPTVQGPLMQPPGFTGPAIRSDALIMDDGARLPLRTWTPEGEPWAVVVGLHGMNDHAQSFYLAGTAWAAEGVATYAYDQRGFGEAPGRGIWAGEERMVQDLRTAVALIRARHPEAIIAVAGESMGGAVAVSAFASDNPPDADRVLLLAPAVWGWSSQPALNRAGLWAAARLLGARAVEPPAFVARAIRPTDNRLELIRMGRDRRMIFATRFDTLSGLVDLMESASASLGHIRAPTLLMYGAHDQIIEQGPMRRALANAGSPEALSTAYYPQGWHLLNRDLGAGAVYADALAFLRSPDAALPSGAPRVEAALDIRAGD